MNAGVWRSPLRAAAVVSVLAGGLLLYAHLGGAYAYVGTRLAGAPAPALRLTDDRGRAFDLAHLRGKAVLVYFGYTHCPDVCPTTLMELGPVFRALGPARSRTRIVFVTLDPRRDTANVLRTYLSAFDPTPIGLTGSQKAIAAASSKWGISWREVRGGAFLDHASVLTLVDPQGRLRAHYGFSQIADPAAMARDIRHVLAG